MKKKRYAKKVYDFERHVVFDRTRARFPGKLKYDIDFKCTKATNALARQWTYGGSAPNLEKAMKDGGRVAAIDRSCKIRIVLADTGEVVKETR